jgi:hypothetical protein
MMLVRGRSHAATPSGSHAATTSLPEATASSQGAACKVDDVTTFDVNGASSHALMIASPQQGNRQIPSDALTMSEPAA